MFLCTILAIHKIVEIVSLFLSVEKKKRLTRGMNEGKRNPVNHHIK
ncbi:hypothetical protein HMPREF9124_0531 [Oribacterium sp. oral taxon 108 str. F0425]|nr:hypothetical protein HMPREF9124_0531 [Oribacterium sp. oral taxon 108 str. F0425]